MFGSKYVELAGGAWSTSELDRVMNQCHREPLCKQVEELNLRIAAMKPLIDMCQNVYS